MSTTRATAKQLNHQQVNPVQHFPSMSRHPLLLPAWKRRSSRQQRA